MTRMLAVAAVAIALAAPEPLVAQNQRFVTVQPTVKLEVLDWGGTGRPIVLLAGLGNTAHVFDDLARLLRGDFHVYGITRRGFGRSSIPDDGYTADRLGDDVLAVIDTLRLAKPVLAGHSLAGEELSSIGSRHGDKVSALIYLDAADSYAFYDTTTGDPRVDLAELRRMLDTVRSAPIPRVIDKLLTSTLPAFERDLRALRDIEPPGPPPMMSGPTTQDMRSFAAFHDWRVMTMGFSPPIAELREQFEELADGGVGRPLRSPLVNRRVTEAILQGEQKYFRVSAPVLALFAVPSPPTNFPSPQARSAALARDSVFRARQMAVIRSAAPLARIIEFPNAQHMIFLSNERDVVREINAFVKSLPR